VTSTLRRINVRSWEVILATTALFLSTGALLPLLVFGPDTGDAHLNATLMGSFVTEIVWTTLYAVCLAVAFARKQRLVATLLSDRIISLFLALAILSTLWSDAPSTSLWESARLVATTLFAIYLATAYSLEDIFRMVAAATALAAVLSIIVGLALPQYGLSDYMHRTVWIGVFDQKNSLGSIMTFGALTWLIYALGGGHPRWLGALFFTTCSVAVVLSASATSLVVECILVLTILTLVRVHSSIRIVASLVLLIIGTWFVMQVRHPVDVVLAFLNRDQDLTGRTEIWSMVLDAIFKHPWLGYGYHAFWRGSDGPSADIRLGNWIPPHAHNGFLDLALNFGIVGPLLFVYLLAGPGFAALRMAKERTNAVDLFPLISFMFIVLLNLTENTNVAPNSIFWELLVVLHVQSSIRWVQPFQVASTAHHIYSDPTVDWPSPEPAMILQTRR
jgi:exopolysaccharide production protein ExoQ